MALEIPLPLLSQAAMVFGSVGGVIMIGWSLAALAGERIASTAMWLTLAAVFAIVLAALPAGTQGMNVVCALGLAAASSLTAWLGRRLLRRPRDLHERLIGATIGLMVLSSALRVSYLLTWSGPYESHLMYLPPMMVTPFTLLYGVLPVVLPPQKKKSAWPGSPIGQWHFSWSSSSRLQRCPSGMMFSITSGSGSTSYS